MPDIGLAEKLIMGGFGLVILIMLILDLGYFNRKSHKVSNKEALTWTGIWIGLAMLFGAFIFFYIGKVKATEFFTAYLIEEALSVDNLFVFILIFSFFNVPEQYQHKVLFWGILGAIVMRAIFIFSGVWLINLTYLPPMEVFGANMHINVLLTTFGFFLLYVGIKSFKADDDKDKDFSRNWGVRIVKAIFPVSDKYDGGKFFTRENGKRVATPLLLVVAVVEMTDLLFAVDSIPAIFSVSRDPLILYTSNIFAILGLRTLYFLLHNFFHYFAYLKYGLAVILSFIGAKMILSAFYHISSPVSLSVVGGVLLISVLASVVKKKEP